MREIEIAERMALNSAFRFNLGMMYWNDDELICKKAQKENLDANLIWLTRQVLMGPAVVWHQTGKAV
jgi:hypothetical protein